MGAETFQFYNTFNDLTPAYLKDLVAPALPMLYCQRRQNVLREILFRTDSYANSFFPDSVKNWNSIGFEVSKITSLNSFKCFHNPTDIKRLFQLRLSLSPLRKHK